MSVMTQSGLTSETFVKNHNSIKFLVILKLCISSCIERVERSVKKVSFIYFLLYLFNYNSRSIKYRKICFLTVKKCQMGFQYQYEKALLQQINIFCWLYPAVRVETSWIGSDLIVSTQMSIISRKTNGTYVSKTRLRKI